MTASRRGIKFPQPFFYIGRQYCPVKVLKKFE
jgi:hypothetical protein